MKFVIQDTYSLYKEMLNMPDDERLSFYRNELLEPFLELFEKMNTGFRRLCRWVPRSAGFLKKDRYNSRKSSTY